MKKSNAQIILDTLENINRSLESDSNACVSISHVSNSGAPAPERNYVRLVAGLLQLEELL